MSPTNKPDKQPLEKSMKEGSSKNSSPSSPNSRQGRSKESSVSQSHQSPSKPKSSQLGHTEDRTSGGDGRQKKNAISSVSSKAGGKRTSQPKDINVSVAQSFKDDHKEGSGSSGTTSAGSRSTGKTSSSGNPVSDPGSTTQTTPTRSPRASQINSPGRASVSAPVNSTPEPVTMAKSRLPSEDRMGSSSNATEKCPIICSVNKFEHSAIMNLNIYRIGFFPNTPPREQCRLLIQGLHAEPKLRRLSKGYASDYASNLLTIGDIPDAAKEPIVLPVPSSETSHDGPPRCHFLIQRISSIPVQKVLDYVLTRPSISLPGPSMESNLQALSILIPRRYQDSIHTYLSKSYSKFYPLSKSSLDWKKYGLELTRGYVMDVSTSNKQLSLHAASCTAVYYPEMALSELIETFEIKEYNKQGIEMLEKQLVGLKVRITYDKTRKDKVKTIKSIGPIPQDIEFFGNEGNSSTDVIAHFGHKWHLKIKKPQLPAVNLGSLKETYPSNNTNHASSFRNPQGEGKPKRITTVYVPPELCLVMPNQLRRCELSVQQKQIVTTFASESTKVDINRTIRDGLHHLGSPSKLPESRVFDLQNRQNQIAISKLIRKSPMLTNEDTNSNAGRSANSKETSRNIADKSLISRANVRNWSVLGFNGDRSAVKHCESEIVEHFQQALKDRGWNKDSIKSKNFTMANPSPVAMSKALQQAKDSGVEILLVVLPDRNTTKQETFVRSSGHDSPNRSIKNLSQRGDRHNVGLDAGDYSTLKRIADTELGIHTVCSKAVTLTKYTNALDEKMLRRTCANIALKFNLKCGGSSQIIANRDSSLEKSKTMVVGIHITPKIDPSSKDSKKPSKKNKHRAKQGLPPTRPCPPPKCMKNAPRIVGMVANSSHTLGQWPGSLRSQASDLEKPQDLGAMIAERLEKWQMENKGSLPSNILIYRSGASEGQYKSIVNEEFECIRSACAPLYSKQNSRPKLSMIIVTRLHNSGFAAIEGDSKLGTFVEEGLAKAKEDFALQASIPVLQNEKRRKAKMQGPKTGEPNTGLPRKAAPTHTRPARYVVLRDDIKFGIDALETITHDLCYAVGTTTGAVSVCAPIHYARLLCEHSKNYSYETYNQEWAPDNSNRAVFEGNPEMLSEIYKNMELKNTMFYV